MANLLTINSSLISYLHVLFTDESSVSRHERHLLALVHTHGGAKS